MNLSEIFIKRPVMTILIMLAIAFFGVISYRAMAVSDLPSVEFPTIQVSVNYPGASPETISNTVVVPLEKQFATISGIQNISSTSNNGSATIVLQFNLNKSIDLAAPDVQSAINAAQPQLPQDLPYAPTYEKVNPTASPVLFMILTTKTLQEAALYEYADTFIGRRLNMIDGVSQVQIYGSPYAVRLRVDPEKLAARGIDINDVGQAIRNANVYLPTGTLFGNKQEFTIDVKGQIYEAAGYEELILKNDNGSITRFRDIGQALDSTQNDKLYLHYFTKDTDETMVGLAIRKQPGTNTLGVIERINDELPFLQSQLPSAVNLVRIYDQSEYIYESVHDVQFTLLLALALVVLVIFIYLGKLIDTIIPALAIPMSVLGTFIVMAILGYSVDILSLLAITLSIGFLIDDAIVVLENIVRHVESGKTPYEASFSGTKQISVTIVTMTLCLAAVFIPILFMEGIIGRLLREFGATIIIAVLFSGMISLSLTPLLCSRFIPRYRPDKPKGKLEIFSHTLNTKLIQLYQPSLEWALRHRKTMFIGGFCSLALTLALFFLLPKDFLPEDDIGFVQVFTLTKDGTSPFQIADYQDKLSRMIRNDPDIEKIVVIGGTPQDNQGVMYLRLKPLGQRGTTSEIVARLFKQMNQIPGVQVFLKPIPLIDLQVGAQAARGNYQYTLQSLNDKELNKYAKIMEHKLKSMRGLAAVNTDLDIDQPQLHIEILRDKASLLNLNVAQIENALNLAYANSNLSPINEPQNLYYAIMETLPHFYRDPSKLSQIWLRSSTNNLVPLTSCISMSENLGPLTVNRLNGLPSATIAFNLDNIPLETAIKNVNKLARETLPDTVFGSIQGAANIFTQSFANLTILLLITLFIIYVILGILYENFFHPITVMSTLPPAALGGLLSLLITRNSFTLYAFVGIILLLGIVMKNGIILVDFANEEHLAGKSPHEAITSACLTRFRPILMTTIAALMGAVPIAIGFPGGLTALGRRPLGIVIVGGLIFSQILTLYLTPVTYVYIEKFRLYWQQRRKEKEESMI